MYNLVGNEMDSLLTTIRGRKVWVDINGGSMVRRVPRKSPGNNNNWYVNLMGKRVRIKFTTVWDHTVNGPSYFVKVH